MPLSERRKEETLGLSDDHLEFFAEWVAEGGLENALRDALMAAKAIPATPNAAVDFVSRACITGAAILRNLNEQEKKGDVPGLDHYRGGE